jgi:hypothetical protein
MAETRIGAATQIGALEYQLFAEWYQNTYGQNPPRNDAAIVTNPQYQFWKTVIRTSVWSPNQETQSTVNRLTGGVTTATPPPLVPTETALAKTGTRVVSINGYDFMEIDGQIIPDPIGKTQASEDKLTAWQQSQIGMQNAQYGTQYLQQQEMNRRLADLNAYNRGNEALMGNRINWEADIRNEERNKMAQQYDIWKARLMTELSSSPRSWIQYQQLKNKANPYTVTPMTQNEEIQNTRKGIVAVQKSRGALQEDINKELKDAAKKEVDDAKASLKSLNQRAVDDYTVVDTVDVLNANLRYQDALNTLNETEKALTERLVSQQSQWEADKSVPGTEAYYATPRPAGDGTGNMAIGAPESRSTPQGIPTPAWMGAYLSNPTPYLTKQELAPISGQALNRITPTQLQQLYGYQDWTGQNVSDWLQTSQQQLTNNPYVSGRWTPKRQTR